MQTKHLSTAQSTALSTALSKSLPATLSFTLLVASLPVLADTKVVREHSFDLADIRSVEIHGSVGSIEVLPARGDRIELTLDIESKRDGWFDRKRDVSEVDLQSRVRNGRLILEQQEEHTETHWLVRLPEVPTTELHLGVGSIDAELGRTELDVHMGVGEVILQYPEDAAGEIRLKVGVGEASIAGDAAIQSKRAFVSQDVSASGKGDQDINVDVGVGQIELDLF